MRVQNIHRHALWFGLAAAISLAGCIGGSSPPQPTAVTEMGKPIFLNPGVTASAPGTVSRNKTRVSMSTEKRVRWTNATTVQQKIQFTQAHWIFEEPYQSSIIVDGGRKTGWFNIRADVVVGVEHPYNVVPLLSTGPPGEPTVTADP